VLDRVGGAASYNITACHLQPFLKSKLIWVYHWLQPLTLHVEIPGASKFRLNCAPIHPLVFSFDTAPEFMDQNPFLQEQVRQSFVDNPEPRCPSLLILDVSGSMSGEPIRQLQAGVEVYRDSLYSDALARKRVEIAILNFGGRVELVSAFCTVDNFIVPTLEVSGDTPMGQAVVEGLDILESQKTVYKQHGISYFRPWVFLITDGAPTDAHTHFWTEAKQRIREGESARKFSFFAVGVEGADMNRLAELCVREALKLKGLEFRKMFEWLSASQQAVSSSNLGETVKLPAPTGWTEV
jgi:uncharacterized protein YegL